MTKKVFITIRHNSVQHNFLVGAEFVSGRAQVSEKVINHLLDKIGIRRGDTYSIG